MFCPYLFRSIFPSCFGNGAFQKRKQGRCITGGGPMEKVHSSIDSSKASEIVEMKFCLVFSSWAGKSSYVKICEDKYSAGQSVKNAEQDTRKMSLNLVTRARPVTVKLLHKRKNYQQLSSVSYYH